MKIYSIVKIQKGADLEQIFNDCTSNIISPASRGIDVACITSSGSCSSNAASDYSGKTVYSAARGYNRSGFILITDSKASEDDIKVIAKGLTNYNIPLSQLQTEVDLNNFRASSFARITQLGKDIDRSSLSILLPLRTKLNEESDNSRKKAAEMMIHSIEDALLDKLEGRISKEDFRLRLNTAVKVAEPVLEQQSGWKKIIDDVVNAFLNLFTKNNQRISLFSPSKQYKTETDDLLSKANDLKS